VAQQFVAATAVSPYDDATTTCRMPNARQRAATAANVAAVFCGPASSKYSTSSFIVPPWVCSILDRTARSPHYSATF
jgi:hypothetical protein